MLFINSVHELPGFFDCSLKRRFVKRCDLKAYHGLAACIVVSFCDCCLYIPCTDCTRNCICEGSVLGIAVSKHCFVCSEVCGTRRFCCFISISPVIDRNVCTVCCLCYSESTVYISDIIVCCNICITLFDHCSTRNIVNATCICLFTGNGYRVNLITFCSVGICKAVLAKSSTIVNFGIAVSGNGNGFL